MRPYEMNYVFTSDQTVRFLFGPLAMHHRTLSSPARISPASTTEQKHHQENNQYGFHVSPPLLEEAAPLIHPAALWFSTGNIIMSAKKAAVCPIVTTC